MSVLLNRLRRVLAAALVLAAPSGAAVVESVRLEAPRAPLSAAAVPSPATLSAAPAFSTTLSAPSAFAAPSAAPSAAPAPAVSAWEDARAAARRLAERRGVPAADHGYFHEMIARYLYNGYDDATLSGLARSDDPLPGRPDGDRWAVKIARDLDQPYDDKAALARLDHLQAELEDCVRWLQARAPGGGYRLAVMGGLLRGRVSAHSDVDLMLETDDADLMRDAMTGPFGYLTKGRDAVLGPVPQNPRLRAAMGETIDLRGGDVVLKDPAFLRGVFFRARAALAAAPMERDAPLDAELMARIKAAGRRFDEARDEAERMRLEAEIDALVADLPPPAAPLGARAARVVPVGAALVDLRAPAASKVLATVGRADGRPVIGLYQPGTGQALNSFVLGADGVREHRNALPKDADPRDYIGWTAQLTPDGRLRFVGSGGVPGELTPRLLRRVQEHLGVRPAQETAVQRWRRRGLALWDRLALFLFR